MISRRTRRDNTLLDALEAAVPVEFDDPVWRVVRAGRDPIVGSASAGRWDDGTFDVLYTSAERDGAIAEIYFHLRRGQPVFPSRMRFHCHELQAALGRALRLADMAALASLGVDPDRYGSLDYISRNEEYTRTQEIAEAAHFLDYDGLIVPSARWECQNIVLFTDKIEPEALSQIRDHGPIDWDDWRHRNS